MTFNHPYRVQFKSLALVVLLGLSAGAQAVCVNADGTLDDPSMNTALSDRGLLPQCDKRLDKAQTAGKDSAYPKAQAVPLKANSEKKMINDKNQAARLNPS